MLLSSGQRIIRVSPPYLSLKICGRNSHHISTNQGFFFLLPSVLETIPTRMKAHGPDGLEAWCVALAACVINFIMAGLGRMSGIMYVAFIDIFQVERREASVPFSARSLTRNLLGPVVGIIGQKYGVRVSSVAGGIIGTLSTVCCFYGNNILWITIVWGVIGGLGAAMTTTLNQVLLGQHFEKYRTTAAGMSFSGGCVGSFLFPALIEYLLHKYGLNGTYLILAGIIMHVIPAAMLLRKPTWKRTEPRKNVELSESHHVADRGNATSLGDRRRTAVNDESWKKGQTNAAYEATETEVAVNFSINTEFLRQNNRLVTLLLTTNFADRQGEDMGYSCLPRSNLLKELEEIYNVIDVSMEKVNPPHKDNNSKNVLSVGERKEILRKLRIHTKVETKEIILLLFKKLLREDVRNITALFPEDEHRSISRTIEQIRQIYCLFMECETYYELPVERNTPKVNTKKPDARSLAPDSNTFANHIKTAFRIQANPIFLLICLSKSVHFITFVPAVTTIVDFSMDKGLLEEEGKYIIAALSLGDLIGRLCLGWVTDRKYIRLPRYMFLVMILQGICTASLSSSHSRPALYFHIGMFGMLQGSLFVRHPVLVSTYLGSNEQSVAMGCFNFYSGLLGFVLPIYIGYFRDTVGSYNCIFYINGACGTIVGILWLLEPFLVRWGNKNRESDSNCRA